jgi:prepilin-type N-terminal cleavage/methylation domain-containing protein
MTQPNDPRHRRPTGYTLVELVTALAIVSVLILGMGSAMLVASRAADPDNRPGAVHTTAEAAARLARDLAFATTFTERSALAVTFTVADRTGDAAPETIRYAWAGSAGDPLTRQYNGNTAETVLDDVRELALAYDIKTVTETPSATRTESGEVLLSARTTPADPKDFAVKEKEWVGQYFKPTLPGDAVSWRVTRVLVKSRIHGAAKGIAGVQLRLPDGSTKPSTTVLEQCAMYEYRLTDGYLWQEFDFSNAAGLSPSRGLCLTVICFLKDADICDIQYDNAAADGGMRKANSGEGSWSTEPGKSLLYAVYGTVTTGTTPDPVTRKWLRGVRLRLRAGPDPSTAVETGTAVYNVPEVTD